MMKETFENIMGKEEENASLFFFFFFFYHNISKIHRVWYTTFVVCSKSFEQSINVLSA